MQYRKIFAALAIVLVGFANAIPTPSALPYSSSNTQRLSRREPANGSPNSNSALSPIPEGHPASQESLGRSIGSNLFWVFKYGFYYQATIYNYEILRRINDVIAQIYRYEDDIPEKWVLPIYGSPWLEFLVYRYNLKTPRKVKWGDLVDSLVTMERNLGGHALFQCNTIDIFSRDGNALVGYARLRTIDFQVVGFGGGHGK